MISNHTYNGIGIYFRITGITAGIKRLTFRNVTALYNSANSARIGNSGVSTYTHEGLLIDGCNWSDCVGSAGGTAIDGWDSSTGYGTNIIRNSVFNRNYGLNGGINILGCKYVELYDNEASGNFAYEDSTKAVTTIDGNGMLIDNDCDHIKVVGNICSNNN